VVVAGRRSVAHPLAGGVVVAGLGRLAGRGEGSRRGRGDQVEKEEENG
jgi:hypothetical protein